jgi:hypothetical protein
LTASVAGAVSNVLTASGKVRSGKSWSGKLSGSPSGKGAEAETAPSEAAPEKNVEGLRQVLKAAKVATCEAAAVAWFDAQGLSSIDDLKEVEMENELVAAMQLKPGAHKLLLKKIAQYTAPAAPTSPSGVASASASQKMSSKI